MSDENDRQESEHLPASVTEFIGQLAKKIRYRRKVREEVKAELTAHFEDELSGCAEGEQAERARRLVADFGDPKLLGILVRRAKKRCRPLWQKTLVRGVQAFGIFVLYLVVCSIPLLIGKPTPSIDYVEWLNDFVRADRSESNNAQPYYEKASELHAEMPKWLGENMSSWPSDFNEADSRVLTDWLEDNRRAIEILREGSLRAGYWNQYHTDETRLDKDLVANAIKVLPRYRRLAFTMRWQIRRQADVGNLEAAISDSIALTKFGGHLQGHGFLIEQMVGIAIEAMASGEILKLLDRFDMPAHILANTYRQLEGQFERQEPIVSLEAEKVFWYDGIQRGFTDDGQGNGRILARGLPYVVTNNHMNNMWKLASFSLPDRKEMVARIDQHYAHFADVFSKTPWELQDERVNGARSNAGIRIAPVLLENIASAMPKLNRQCWRIRTDRKALLTILAVMRYEKSDGHYPADLDALVGAGYLKQLPMDPFSGRTLVYRRTDDSFTLYSFGPNFQDDGGISGTGSSGRARKWADDGDTVFWPLLTHQARS